MALKYAYFMLFQNISRKSQFISCIFELLQQFFFFLRIVFWKQKRDPGKLWKQVRDALSSENRIWNVRSRP